MIKDEQVSLKKNQSSLGVYLNLYIWNIWQVIFNLFSQSSTLISIVSKQICTPPTMNNSFLHPCVSKCMQVHDQVHACKHKNLSSDLQNLCEAQSVAGVQSTYCSQRRMRDGERRIIGTHRQVSKAVIRRSSLKGGIKQAPGHEVVLCPLHMLYEYRHLDSHARLFTYIEAIKIKI